MTQRRRDAEDLRLGQREAPATSPTLSDPLSSIFEFLGVSASLRQKGGGLDAETPGRRGFEIGTTRSSGHLSFSNFCATIDV